MHLSRALVLGLALAIPGAAQVPSTLRVEGSLGAGSSSGGQPRSGPLTVTAQLWDAPVGGSAVSTDTEVVLPDAAGRFVQTLGDPTPLDPGVFDQPLWLELTLDGEAAMARVPLQASLAALRAARAGSRLARELFVDHTGDAAASGAALLAALGGLSPATSGSEQLVVVGPGVFDVGSSTATVPAFTTLRGSGAGATRILGSGSDVVELLSGAHLQDVHVVLDGGVSEPNAVRMLAGGNVVRDSWVELTDGGAGIVSAQGNEIHRTRVFSSGAPTTNALVGIFLNGGFGAGTAQISRSQVELAGSAPGAGGKVGVSFQASTTQAVDLDAVEIRVADLASVDAVGLQVVAAAAVEVSGRCHACLFETSSAGTATDLLAEQGATIRVSASQFATPATTAVVTAGTFCGAGNFTASGETTGPEGSCP